MQAALRRGFSASIINLSRYSRTIPSVSRITQQKTVSFPAVNSKLLQISSIHTSTSHQSAQATAEETMGFTEDVPEQGLTRFEQLGEENLNPLILDTIVNSMKLETMTPVQAQTIHEGLQGKDILALARTGTGKTVAFLLPVIQRMLQTNPDLAKKSRRADVNIQSVIISPTRELAEQIAKEARRMTANTGIEVGLAVGGTGRDAAIRNMRRFGCHILVGTPGRLHDVLSDQDSPVKTPNLTSFVLDEADRLLDDGFGPAIEKIYREFPSKLEVDRQTLMFSATMEQEVMGMVRKFMKKDFRTVQTVAEGELQTHEKVPQYAVVTAGLENQMPTLFELIRREATAMEKFKAIVFFNTAAEASLANDIWTGSGLNAKLKIPGSVMSSRLTQSGRTKTSDKFKQAQSAIMFASDVAARGMDFPNVTHVVQVGMPKDRDTYIHRVGRTGRAGKDGQGWVILLPWERNDYNKKLRNLPITGDTSLKIASLDMTQSLSIPASTAELLTDVIQSARATTFDAKFAAYRSCLAMAGKMNKEQLIASLNRLAKFGWGLDEPPKISSQLAKKIGLARTEGMNIGEDPRLAKDGSHQSSGHGRGGRPSANKGRSDGGGSQRGGRARIGSQGGFLDRAGNSEGRRPSRNAGRGSARDEFDGERGAPKRRRF